MAVSATMVKQLRDKTGAGMMDAKKALIETDGDMEAAVDLLRVKGLAKADKKAGRTAAEGLVALAVDGGRGVAVEVNSETDFVARNADFQQMCRQIAETALKGDGDVEALRSAKLGDKTVSEVVTEKVATIGENMNVRRLERLEGGTIASYVHNAAAENMGRIGVLVAVEGDAAAAAAIGKQVAMHVAATSPASLDQNDLDASLVERERQVLSEQARASGKPEQVIEKMIEGRMKKFFQEVCLVEQAFVVNPDQTVGQAVAEAGCKVTGFVRLAVGEGIEKEDEDFAAEVAKIGG